MERHKFAYISTPSNTVLSVKGGALHAVVLGANSAGGTVRIDDTHRFQAGTVSASATSSNTIGLFTSTTTGLAIGLDTGLAIAVSSNASVTIEYEGSL